MYQNCSISVLVDPGGAKKKFENLAHPRYNYDVQSIDSGNAVSPSFILSVHPIRLFPRSRHPSVRESVLPSVRSVCLISDKGPW